MRRWVDKFNEAIAVTTTNKVSTMWCAYAFVMLSAMPLWWSTQKDNILYLSNCFQLVFLPLIMVGSNVLNKKAEQRAEHDHKILMQELSILRDIVARLEFIRHVKK